MSRFLVHFPDHSVFSCYQGLSLSSFPQTLPPCPLTAGECPIICILISFIVTIFSCYWGGIFYTCQMLCQVPLNFFKLFFCLYLSIHSTTMPSHLSGAILLHASSVTILGIYQNEVDSENCLVECVIFLCTKTTQFDVGCCFANLSVEVGFCGMWILLQ